MLAVTARGCPCPELRRLLQAALPPRPQARKGSIHETAFGSRERNTRGVGDGLHDVPESLRQLQSGRQPRLSGRRVFDAAAADVWPSAAGLYAAAVRDPA